MNKVAAHIYSTHIGFYYVSSLIRFPIHSVHVHELGGISDAASRATRSQGSDNCHGLGYPCVQAEKHKPENPETVVNITSKLDGQYIHLRRKHRHSKSHLNRKQTALGSTGREWV